MKAIVFTELCGADVMKLTDVPKPDIRPGMLLVRNHAIGINFADTLFRPGRYAVQPRLPDTPGLEAAGVVEAVGDGVSGFTKGMRVAAFASKTYAEYCLAPAAGTLPLPDHVSFEHGAAFLIQGLTAYHILHTADSTGPGRTVLVHSAAGVVGILAVQLAKIAGARVLGTVSSDAKAALVKDAGADGVVNYSGGAFADEVRKLSDGRGADLIMDAVGKPTFAEDLRCVAPLGHIVLYGRAGGPPDPLDTAQLYPACAKVSGFRLPTIVQNFPDRLRESAARCFGLIREGRLKIHVGKTFPLAQAPDAHRHIESRQSTGKILLVP